MIRWSSLGPAGSVGGASKVQDQTTSRGWIRLMRDAAQMPYSV